MAGDRIGVASFMVSSEERVIVFTSDLVLASDFAVLFAYRVRSVRAIPKMLWLVSPVMEPGPKKSLSCA
jgi:hypothetical protein